MDDPSLVLKVRSDLYPHMSNSVKFRYAEQTRCLTTSPKSVTSDECMNLPKQIPSPLVEVHESSSQDPRYIKSPSPSKFTNSVLVQENCPLSSEVEVQNVMTDIELSNKGLGRRELDSRTIESEHEDNGDSALNESDIDIEVDVETTVPQSPQGSDKCVTPVGMASKTCSYQSKGSPNLWEGSPIVKDSNEYDLVQVENGRIISAQSASKSPETSGLFKCSSPPCEDSSRTPFSSNPLNELLPTPPDESVYSGIHPLLINSPFAGGRSFINGNFGKVSETDPSDLISSSRPLFPDHAPFQSPLNAPAFNPFGVLPSLTRLQELHSTYLKRDEDGPEKTSVNGPFQDMTIPTHLIPWLISSQIQSYVQHQMALNSGEGRSFGADPLKGVYLPEDRDQQPLDLSAKSIPTGPPMYHETTSLNCPIDIKIASRGRRRTDSNKRNYTERELQAALQDIQSGKLGTRRAAVIYGIPRSTLRNKVYKLQAMKNNELNNAEKSIGPVPELIHQKDVPLLHGNELEVDKLGSESAEAKLLLKRRMFEKIEELSRNSEKHLNFNDKNRVLDSALSYLCENIPKLALNVDNQNSPKDIFSSLSLYPQMQDIVNKIIEDRFNEEIRKFNSTNDDNRRVDDNESVFNKTYVSSNDNNSTNIANYDYDITSSQSNVKDVISQMIQQKMLNSSSHPNYSTQCITPPQFSMSKISMNAVNYDRQNQAKGDHNEDPNKKREKSPTNNGGKGSRPKRGKYRNYDRDNLIKAVQSVQRGEMSVHRAGSYYGVPHSTLEYKVKERHLNKSRNKKDNFMTKVADTSPISSSLRHPNISNDFISHSLAYRNKENENDSNDEVSIIGCSATRSGYKSENDSNDVGKVSGPPNVYLSNTFPFMNNSSFLHPLLNPSFSVDSSLNSSGIIRNIQKSTLSSKATDQRPNNSSPEDTKDNEGSHYSYNFPDKDFVPEGTSFTPPSSPKSVQETLFNRLLSNKFQSNVGDNIKDLEPDSQKETPNFPLSSADPAEIMRLKALLPSYLAARSVAAAIANNNINHNDENLPNEKKESLHIPVVSGTNSSDL